MNVRIQNHRSAGTVGLMLILSSSLLVGCSRTRSFTGNATETGFQTPEALSSLDESLHFDSPAIPPKSDTRRRGRLRALRLSSFEPKLSLRTDPNATAITRKVVDAASASPSAAPAPVSIDKIDKVLRLADASPDAVSAKDEASSVHISRVSNHQDSPDPEQNDSLSISVMDLGTVLSMVGGHHPAVGFARWRVQEAQAEQERAHALWLPSIQAGMSVHQHDGNLQASNGSIQDVNRSSLQAGLGTGAVGAGTTPSPGIVARFHMADAIFAPSIAEKNLWAQGHAASAAMNDQLLTASLAWLQLLTAEQRVAIVSDSLERTEQLSQLTMDFAESGQGLRSDAERMLTEKSLVRTRLVAAREDAEVSGVRLVEAISARPGQRFIPAEKTIVPIQLVSAAEDSGQLISQGLRQRPELREAQCLVAAACERYQRQKYGPFVPSVLLGMSQTGFGGGHGLTGDSVNDRTDFDAALTWELRGLGYGEQAARRSSAAQVEQARYRQARLMDQIAREIAESHTQVRFREQRITVAERGIESAEEAVRHNLDRIRNGQGLPIEALQAIRALEDARLGYLQAVSDYNEAQFRLYRAMGHSVFAAAADS